MAVGAAAQGPAFATPELRPRTVGASRSHPNLVALEALRSTGLSYRGWKADVRMVEKDHERYPSLARAKLEEMKQKKRMHEGDRRHPLLKKLDHLVQTGPPYPALEAHVREVEDMFHRRPSVAKRRLVEIESLQRREDPNLQALDQLIVKGLTYIGWERTWMPWSGATSIARL